MVSMRGPESTERASGCGRVAASLQELSGLVSNRSRALRTAHQARHPAPTQLLSNSALQGRGAGKVAMSRIISSTICRIVSVGSFGRLGLPRRR